MKADQNTITQFSVKVMSKYKVLSRRERGVIKKNTYGLNTFVYYGAHTTSGIFWQII